MPQRVLVIDDCVDMRDLIPMLLAGEPMTVTTASSGIEGLRLCREISPDLVLLDVDMPSLDGFEVCRQLKMDPATDNIPVVFLSGKSSTAEKINGLNLGAMDYVTKPFDAAELRARVGVALRTKFLVDLLAQRASMDGLTGLWNRQYFDSRLREEIAAVRRYGRPVGCILLDIDHFKLINDRYGHPAGDFVLRGVSNLLRDICRAEDVVCRVGGEEFGVVAREATSAGLQMLGERIRKAMAAARFPFRNETLQITASVGISISSCEHVEGHNLLYYRTDQALYEAKNSGRNQCTFASPVSEPVLQ